MDEITNTSTTTETAPEVQEITAEPTQAANTSEKTEKTFTQSELDAAIQSRLDRERKNQPSKEELKAFREWQESQKSEAEKVASKIQAAEEAKTIAEQRAAEYEAKCAAMSKGIRAEAVADVIALAKSKVSDDVTLEQAIDSIIAKYPQFSSVAEKPSTTGVSTPNNKGGYDDSLLRKAMGLPDETKG